MSSFRGTVGALKEAPWCKGPIPGWHATRLKWTVSSAISGLWGNEADGGHDDVACVRVADFDRDRLRANMAEPTMRSVPINQQLSRRLKQGDLLLEKSGGGAQQPVGAVVTFDSDERAITSNFVTRLRPAAKCCPRYLTYLHAFLYYGRVNTRSIKQTTGIQNLDAQSYLDEVTYTPPFPTQRAIAAFLDRKTAAIDALIEKKQRLLDLLDEKRTTLINQAVTKGLDPTVPMKDSGTPWIGDIPAHWEIHHLRRMVKRFIDFRGRTPQKTDQGTPLITAGAVRDGFIDHDRAPEWVESNVAADLNRRGHPEVGDLLFTSEAPLGEVGIVGDPNIACAQRIIMFKTDPARMLSGFLRLHFLAPSGRREIKSRASGSTAEGIRADRLKMSLVPCPPLEEQAQIVSHIELHTNGDHAIGAAVSLQIGHLSEYRQSLITAAVTGQLPLPEDAT